MGQPGKLRATQRVAIFWQVCVTDTPVIPQLLLWINGPWKSKAPRKTGGGVIKSPLFIYPPRYCAKLQILKRESYLSCDKRPNRDSMVNLQLNAVEQHIDGVYNTLAGFKIPRSL